MENITADKTKLQRLEIGCKNSQHRNIDNYLEQAVYKDFQALVVIDEARDELHNVLQKINALVSVLTVKAFKSDNNEFIYQYDTLYDVDELVDLETATKENSAKGEDKNKRSQRRAQCDTILVAAQEEGFKREFLGNNVWHAVRISAAMLNKIKYIAAYQVAPVSAITHIAEVDTILPYQNTGKYILKFKQKAEPIKPIKLKNPNKKPQGPIYIKYSDLKKAKTIDDLIEY